MKAAHRFDPSVSDDLPPAASALLFSRAGHDLCQPFQAMALFIHLLDGQLTTSAQRDLLAHIQKANQAGETLLRKILDVAALRAGRRTVCLEPLSLATVLGPHIAPWAAEAQKKGLRFATRLSAAPVLADRGMIELIFKNLMENALRVTTTGGILIGSRPKGDRLSVGVYDTGCGIAPEKISTIFDDFQQEKSKVYDQNQGNGLGLSIVRLAARTLNAPLNVTSEQGRGSTFSIDLPRAS